MIIHKILKDDIFETEICIEQRYSTIMPDIKTAIEMTRIANKLDLALQKLKTLSKEELLKAKTKIENYIGYSSKEKEWILYQLNKIYNYEE